MSTYKLCSDFKEAYDDQQIKTVVRKEVKV